MGVPSRTSAPTPALDQRYLDFQIILGKVRLFTSPGRGPSTGSDHCWLARELGKTHPNAAGSLREGLEETLTVLRLGLPPALLRTFRSTNAVESMISISREHAKNVKRWRDAPMALRWCAAGMVEASKQFRRVNGHLHLPTLRAALERETETVTAASHNGEVNAA